MLLSYKRWFNLPRLILCFCLVLVASGYFLYDKLGKKLENLQQKIQLLESEKPTLTLGSEQPDHDLQIHLAQQKLLQVLFHAIPGVCLQEIVVDARLIRINGFAHSYAEMGQALTDNVLFKNITHLNLALAKKLPIIIFKAQANHEN